MKLCNMGNHGSTVDSFVLSIQNIDTSRYYGTLPAMIFGPERWPSRAGYSTTWVGSALTVTFDGPSVAAPDRSATLDPIFPLLRKETLHDVLAKHALQILARDVLR